MLDVQSPNARLQVRALYEQVAEHLRERIFAGELKPGEWIDELKIAAEYGISRTPLREALKVLQSEGLVDIKVRRGAYVAESSAKQLRDIFHLMALLESDAAYTVAAKADPQVVKELQTIHAELKRSIKDRRQFFLCNEQFHEQLLHAAGNEIALEIIRDLRKKMKFNRHHSLHKEGRIEASFEEHDALMNALAEGNASAAKELMQRHILNGQEAAT
jgi:DNA-binding GntR family transcriptional regulator